MKLKILIFCLLLDLLVVQGDDCAFRCNGTSVLRPNLNYEPSANGCGTSGLFLDFHIINLAQLTECCNRHDVCYSTCGLARTQCDTEFKQCLNKQCQLILQVQHQSTCLEWSQVMYFMVDQFGCSTYLNTQQAACTCV